MEPDLSPLTEDFYRRKVGQIQERLYENRVDGLLLLDAHNVTYASGFFHSPTERPVGFYVPARGEPTLFVPLLEQENAGATWVGDIRTYFEYPGEEHPVLWMARECGARRLGIDALPHTLFERVRRLGVMPTITPLVEHLRFVKEPEELLLTAQAARYADVCLQFVKDQAGDILGEGGTELDVLTSCLASTRERMDEELGDAFAHTRNAVVGTVHTGPRAALPHGKPIARVPARGDVLIAGIGASVGGYHGESGATFVLGEPTADQLHCLRAAVACDAAAAAALRPGALCADVNEAGPGGAAGGRTRGAHPPPDRPRHGRPGPRGPVAGAGRPHAPRARHGVLERTRHLPPRRRRLPHHQHADRHAGRGPRREPLPGDEPAREARDRAVESRSGRPDCRELSKKIDNLPAPAVFSSDIKLETWT